MALHYGADAVYLAGSEFGMRAAAGNFSEDELRRAVKLSHEAGVKVYVTCNTLPREYEISRTPAFLEFLNDVGADAVIAADLGVISLAKKHAPKLGLHVSTQMGVTNSAAANMLCELGADRIVLARELGLEEISALTAKLPKSLEIEAFVHGSMCVSFSGRCLISNYLTGRDANRGECAQPCRWKYHLIEEKRPGEYYEITEDSGTHIMNSRDMCMIEHIPALLSAGITSLKIEGRMKSSYYTAVVTNAYRQAVNAAVAGEELSPVWINEVETVSHRPYSTGFYLGEPGQYTQNAGYIRSHQFIAVVDACTPNGLARLTLKNKFAAGEELELVAPGAEPTVFAAPVSEDADGEPLPEPKTPQMSFYMRLPHAAPELSILRRRTGR